METVTISKREYKKLKRTANFDTEIIPSLIRACEDVKNGRIKEWKPSQ